MNKITIDQKNNEKWQPLKKMAAFVYLCQFFTFGLAGLPLIIGLAINYIKRAETKGTWLESHFNWQINTAWMTLIGFALFGLTLGTGISIFILFPTLLLLVYRIVIGWKALSSNKPVMEQI
jgi:uncharacterized membrane protein